MIEYTVKVDNEGTAWYLDGKLHRVGGPAVEYANGDKAWYLNGKRHREDGPAQVGTDGTFGYWIHGVWITESEFNNRVAIPANTMFHRGKKYNITPA